MLRLDVMKRTAQSLTVVGILALIPLPVDAAATQGGALGVPNPLFPASNWWNADISQAPVDTNSTNFINFLGGSGRALHPDFGGIDTDDPSNVSIFGFPYIVVNGNSQAKKTVQFQYSDESDGVNHSNDTSIPFYPIPDEAIAQTHWVEGGAPGNVDQRDDADRHILIVDRDNNYLYELYNVFYDGTRWNAGSGAFFDMNTNNRRPDTWTSADAAGLAILPGLVRYDEVFGTGPIRHAFRVTVQNSNGYVYPASHAAGSTSGALPMGARLRLKPGKNIAGGPEVQRIVQAMKTYGLIVADNGTNMYISGTFDTRWDNGVLNPAFGLLHASDFEVIQRGYNPPAYTAQLWHDFFAVNTLETPYVGDFNGDGKTDIITFTRQNPSAFGDVYVSLSTGTAFTPSSVKWHDFFAIDSSEQVVIGDYNGDGKDDVGTWLSNTTRQFYVALSQGTGMGAAQVWVNSIGTNASDVLYAGDVNGDGRDDLVAFARTDGKVYVALSNGSTFGTPTVWHNFFAVSTYERPRVADLNGDGRADIVTFATDSPSAFGDVYVALSNGTTQFGDKQSSSKWHDFFAIRQTEEVRVGDLDHDNRQDFFTFLPPPFGQCYTSLSQSTSMGASVLWREVVTPASTDRPFVGDANGDGKADIIVFAQGTGKVYVSLAP
jgi:hypothetical protein